MNILIVDDERIARDGMANLIQNIYRDAKVYTFERSDEAIEKAMEVRFDIAFCDIMMEPISGIETARVLSRISSTTNIIFTTGFSNFTKEAMEIHASGYIVKPVTKSKIMHELKFLRYPVDAPERGPRLKAHCFGNFDFYIDGKSIEVAYSKTRELLAYLIDREGAVCSNNEIAAVLGDEDGGDLSYSYLNGIRRDLIKVFSDAGFSDVIVRSRGGLRIVTDEIECDYYELLKGKESAIAAYKGEYMNQYSWAENTNGQLYSRYSNN